MKTIEELKETTPAELLKKAMKTANKTMGSVSRDLGMNKSNVSKFLHGRSIISPLVAKKLEKSIGEEFLSGEELIVCQALATYYKN